MRDYAELMRSGAPGDMTTVAKKRIAFSRLFREHMHDVGAAIDAARGGVLLESDSRILASHSENFQPIFLRYSAHIKYWSPDRIASEWEEYCAACIALQDMYGRQLDWEEQFLVPVLKRALPRAA